MGRMSLLIAGLAALSWVNTARAADICGAPVQGQYAEEIHCASEVLMPDGSVGRAALINAMPDTYPWLFRVTPEGEAPFFTITIKDAGASFTVLQFINGWAPYYSDQAISPQFAQYGRARDIVIETGDGQRLTHTLLDTPEMQFVELPNPASGSVRVSVHSTYGAEGDRGDITAIRLLGIAWEADL